MTEIDKSQPTEIETDLRKKIIGQATAIPTVKEAKAMKGQKINPATETGQAMTVVALEKDTMISQKAGHMTAIIATGQISHLTKQMTAIDLTGQKRDTLTETSLGKGQMKSRLTATDRRIITGTETATLVVKTIRTVNLKQNIKNPTIEADQKTSQGKGTQLDQDMIPMTVLHQEKGRIALLIVTKVGRQTKWNLV